MYCYACRYWKRTGSMGKCSAYSKGKMDGMVNIIVAGGYSTPDEILTKDTFFCAVFKSKHKGI